MVSKNNNSFELTLLLFLTFFFVSGMSSEIQSYQTEKVIVIFMGGVRNTEAFDDPLHQYIPNIAQNILPQGVIYRKFYNLSFTGMATGTFTAVMGVRRSENNRGSSWHGLSPTMFEYYRKQNQVPENKVWAVLANTFNAFGVNYSLHPAFGSDYAASIWGSPNNSDRQTYEEAISIMDTYEPSLMTIHFRKIDREAQHTDNPDLPDSIAFENYTTAIMETDSLINLIWEKIQTDPAYAGKTALFITSAHGRHLPAYGDFEWHGDACDGCRRLPFLAAGPDFRQGEIVDVRGDIIDICPTIGVLLSFDPVFAKGRILEELFISPPSKGGRREHVTGEGNEHIKVQETRLSPPGVHSQSPFIRAIGDVIHVIWTERDDQELLESWNVLYRRSEDGGGTWSNAVPILETIDPDHKIVSIASMSGDGSGLDVVDVMRTRSQYTQGDSAWFYQCESKVSLDGSEWPDEPVNVIPNRKLVTVDNIPATAQHDSLHVTAILSSKWNRYFGISYIHGEDWFNFLVDDRPDEEFSSPDNPSIVVRGNVYYVETMRYISRSRLLFFISEGNTMVLHSIIDDSNDETFFPQLAYSDSVLYCVWSDDRSSHWEVYFSKSTDEGDTWTPNRRLSQSEVNTWNVAVEARHDTLLVVWEDYRDGEGSLYKKVSFDRGDHWSEDYPEVTTTGLSTSPKLSSNGDHYYLVWQDYRNGEWEVYFKDVDVDLPVSIVEDDEGNEAPVPRTSMLLQNYPNPFNPLTEIQFEVPEGTEGAVRLCVYDLRGRQVKVLKEGLIEPGHHRTTWDGSDSSGSPVPSGVYMITFESPDERITRKMMLIR